MLHLILIACFFGIGFLQSCAMQPINEAASALFLKPNAEISRQRHVTVSQLSHIGFYFDSDRIINNPDNADNPLLKPRLSELYEGATQAFASTFADYTKMENPKSIVRSMDFIVHAQLIDMTLTEKSLIEHPNPEIVDETLDEHERVKVMIPTDYLKIKLVLKDARSQRLIDVAYLKTRSGTLDYQKGYAAFAEHSMRHYLNFITK